MLVMKNWNERFYYMVWYVILWNLNNIVFVNRGVVNILKYNNEKKKKILFFICNVNIFFFKEII